MDVAAHPAGELEFSSDSNRARLSRQAKRGDALRIAPGIYAVGATLPPEDVAQHHRFAIIARTWPEAVLMGKTALTGGAPDDDGRMYVAHPDPPRATPLNLPGLTIEASVGPPALPGDMPLPHGLAMSGEARRLLENVYTQGRPPRSAAGTEAVEDLIDDLARRGGAGKIQAVLNELDVISGQFDPRQVVVVRDRLAAVLGTVSDGISSKRLAARLAGEPYDAGRIEMLEGVLETLANRPPHPRPATGDPARWAWLPFFEAYFSNFIEGTEFGVQEARRIAIEGEVPRSRPAEAHDISATYRLVNDPDERSRIPEDPTEFLALLRERHGVLMAARPQKRPGEFKDRPNYAGGYKFVGPDLVVGTLTRGFTAIEPVIDPMARAVALMVLITECHPFDDGNGRIARIASNAELSQAGQVRIVIPNSFRDNYLAALTAVSNRSGHGESLIAVFDYAQRWVAAIDWSSFDGAHEQLERANAYLNPGVAESSGRRLRMPD